MNSKKRGRQIYSHRQTCLTFLRDRWSSTEHDVKTPLLVSGGSCDGSGGLGCIFLSKIMTQPNELSIRKEHWLPTPGGVTCIANAATYGNENDIDVLVIGTETGNVCVVHADKFNGQFIEQETKVFQLESDPRVACSTTAISTARHGNNAVVVTDSGGVYMLTELQQVQQHQQHQSGQSSPKVTKFNVRENSGLNDVTHLQETDCFVTAGASPVAQLKVWDPRVSADGNAIVATFKDENSNVAYTSVASHPQDKHLVMTGTYKSDAVSNVAVIIVKVIFISAFLFYCLLLNHSFPTNPNRITNCFKLILSITTLQLHLLNAFAILIFEQVPMTATSVFGTYDREEFEIV